MYKLDTYYWSVPLSLVHLSLTFLAVADDTQADDSQNMKKYAGTVTRLAHRLFYAANYQEGRAWTGKDR